MVTTTQQKPVGIHHPAYQAVKPRSAAFGFGRAPARAPVGPATFVPGPGSYVQRPATAPLRSPRARQPTGAGFGSSSPRAHYADNKSAPGVSTPGPGTYAMQSEQRKAPRSSVVPMSPRASTRNFAPASPRASTRELGPGSPRASNRNIGTLGPVDIPGPGAYSPRTFGQQAGPKFSFGAPPRISPQRAQGKLPGYLQAGRDSPGPGCYL